ncbi:hypothetical protein B0H13DRAFT_2321544 [Mycena leptocephala]|nr:hypothetical protein B0H13DRAFT_2321544 [Mycena leptocephala]
MPPGTFGFNRSDDRFAITLAFSGPRILRVPTLNTTTNGILNDIYLRDHGYGTVTETWDKAALFSLLSAIPVGWAMPDGCSPQCEYNFTYIAPALRCSDIHSNQIDDMVGDDRYRSTPRVFEDPPSAYLLGYDGLDYQRSSLNFTVQNYASAASDHYTWTLAYLPYSASNGDLGVPINATGSQCTFYNATHIASTHFFNGTQESRVSVVEFHAPLNTTYKSPDSSGYYATALTPLDGSADSTQFLPGVGSHVHLLAIADSLSAHLEGSILIDGHSGVLLAPTTMMMETNLFVPYGNVSQALQQMVANATLGFVKLSGGFTTVVATVASPDIVYVYHHTTLITTYSAAFLVLVLISATGMFSAVKNGEPSSNKFSKLLVALRNPDLEAVAAAVVRKSMDVHRARLRFDAGPQGGREAYRVFYPATESNNSSASSSASSDLSSTSESSEDWSDILGSGWRGSSSSSSASSTDSGSLFGSDSDESMPELRLAGYPYSDEEDDLSSDSWSTTSSSSADGDDEEGLSELEDMEIDDGEDFPRRRADNSVRWVQHSVEEMYAQRYEMPRDTFPRGPAFLRHVLGPMKDTRPDLFRQELRISPLTFDKLITKIAHDPVFTNNSTNGQMPIKDQVAIVLFRFGHSGNASGLQKVANWAGVGKGTITLVTRRVMTAILRPDFMAEAVRMPIPMEKEKAKAWIEAHSCKAWRDGWCMVDGTLVVPI